MMRRPFSPGAVPGDVRARIPKGFPTGQAEISLVFITEFLQSGNGRGKIVRSGDHDVDVENGFGGQSGNGGTTDMLNAQGMVMQSIRQDLTQFFKLMRP